MTIRKLFLILAAILLLMLAGSALAEEAKRL